MPVLTAEAEATRQFVLDLSACMTASNKLVGNYVGHNFQQVVVIVCCLLRHTCDLLGS